MKSFSKILALVGAAGCVTFLATAIKGNLAIDPLDKFEAIAIFPATPPGRFAVLYSQHHADSSADVHSLWILSEPTVVGSRAAPHSGSLAAIWSNANLASVKGWREHKLEIQTADDIGASTNLNRCTYGADSRTVCLNPHLVVVAKNQ